MSAVDIVLTGKQIQFLRAIEVSENVFYGGARGGGKSHGLREIMLLRRAEIPNSYGVIFRKSYPELYGNHIGPLLRKFPALKSRYNSSKKEIRLENGSILAFRHCQYEKDLGLYQGQEYHDLAIDEVGEWPESWFWTLKGSNRSGVKGIQPKCILTGNPGSIGHKWLKRLFVERRFRQMERPKDFAFVQAFAEDNPALMENDPGYIGRLESIPNEVLRRAWRQGDWDIQAGQFFDMLDRNIHVVEPFEIPSHWQRTGGFDSGYNHPAGFIWIAWDTDGNGYVYREFCKPRMRTEEVAQQVMSYPDSLKLQSVPAGHDCWAKGQGGAPSIEEKFNEATQFKLMLERANIDRVQGATQVRDYLALDAKTKKPRLFFFKTCPMTFDTLVRMTHDLNRPEDVLKIDADNGDPETGDDLYDTLRHALMARGRISQEPEDPKKPKISDYTKSDIPKSSWTTV